MRSLCARLLAIGLSASLVVGCALDAADENASEPDTDTASVAEKADSDAGVASGDAALESEIVLEALSKPPQGGTNGKKPGPKPVPKPGPGGGNAQKRRIRKSEAKRAIHDGNSTYAKYRRSNNGWWQCSKDIINLHLAIVGATGACAAAIGQAGADIIVDAGCAAAVIAVEDLTEAVTSDCRDLAVAR